MTDNFFVKKLIELRSITTSPGVSMRCENCSDGRSISDPDLDATKYCLDCHQRICDGCADIHRKLKVTRLHNIIPLSGDETAEVEEMMQKSVMNCGQHPDERINLFCRTCKTVICTVCYATKHREHECDDVAAVSKEFRKLICDDVAQVGKTVHNYREKTKSLDLEKDCFLEELQLAQTAVQNQTDELVSVIKRVQDKLLEELEAVKKLKLKEMEMLRQNFGEALSSMESTELLSKELLSRGSNSDIACMANDLHARMQQLHLRPQSMQFVSVTFTAMDVKKRQDMFTSNLVGKIEIINKQEG